MAEQDTGSKTEPPTPKKLKEARKKGDVAKVPDIALTVGFLFAVLVLWLLSSTVVLRLDELLDAALASPDKPFGETLRALGADAISALVEISMLVLLPIALFTLIVEYLVVGPVLTAEKFKPKMSNLNPANGLKRMFGADNLVELVKSVVKATVLGVITLIVVHTALADLMLLPYATPADLVVGIGYLVIRVFGWTSAVFVLLMFLDALYQHYAFNKRMRMSLRDIRDELKESEGDPMLRGARKDIGQEWAQESPSDAARGASVLVVNPVHIAIAIRYDSKTTPVPLIVGKGEERVAREMRAVAAQEGVPVLRNVSLARALLETESDDDKLYVPPELFNVVAEVILWAQDVRTEMQRRKAGTTKGKRVQAPGEDLTNYGSEPLVSI